MNALKTRPSVVDTHSMGKTVVTVFGNAAPPRRRKPARPFPMPRLAAGLAAVSLLLQVYRMKRRGRSEIQPSPPPSDDLPAAAIGA